MPASPFTRPHFIVNARAARDGDSRRVERLCGLVRSDFPGAPWTLTSAPGHAGALARAAAEAGADLVVAVGGDGTINEVVNGLLAAGAASPTLGILPAGSGSDFVRTIGVPRNPRRALAVLAGGCARRIDIGEIECAPLDRRDGPPTRRFFANIAGCGASGQVVQRFNRRRIPGTAGYAVAAALTAFTYRWPQVQVRLDDGPEHTVRLNLLFVCNGEYCGGGMHVGKGARVDDGILRIVEAGDVSRLQSMLQWPRLYLGGLERVPGVRLFDARSVRVSAGEEVLVDCDGELCGRLPATYRIVPGALNVCVPQAR